ncbi:hypothetical protein [Cellulomonas cellasea]|uniref:DNA-binding transcriptional regulator YiaG n=1 Tax=Cellulomonas cellasea TaxID=43670 RepID=A0A7W4YAW4_9CELL|nr:hypothetical protein [Cellulomonas cellasea]MBB2921866.1 DNA-binding transcriptional regulator YiaG [Cellulomonas cellasea]
MWVLTIDQVASRRVGDRVDAFLADLGALADARRLPPGAVRAFERTVGDEVQGVIDDPELVVEVALDVLRRGGWSIGVGAGDVRDPMPASARAAEGPAFVHARAAVEAAKSRARAVPLAVRGHDAAAASDAEGVLVLLAATVRRRTEAGWAVVDAMRERPDLRQDQVASRLGITQQAVSQRLRTALWHEELAARPAAARLLRLAEALG